MAETQIPAGMTVEQWDSDYFEDYINKNWFRPFMGAEMDALIHVNEDLSKAPGDAITFNLINELVGEAKNQNDTLEGNEEELSLRSFKITIDEYAHAVKWKKFDQQKTKIELRQAHRSALRRWNDKLDRDKIIRAFGAINRVPFAQASAAQRNAWLANNADRVLFGANRANNTGVHAASLANIDNTDDRLSAKAVDLMKRMAKEANPKVTPYIARSDIAETASYVLFTGTRGVRDLKQDPTFVQANREARQRGLDNPLFSGANLIWDNVYVYEIEDLPVYANVGAGGTVDVAPSYLCGAGAVGVAWAKRPITVDGEMDYKRKNGLSIQQWYEIEKLLFGAGPNDTDNPKDHGVVTGYFAAEPDQ